MDTENNLENKVEEQKINEYDLHSPKGFCIYMADGMMPAVYGATKAAATLFALMIPGDSAPLWAMKCTIGVYCGLSALGELSRFMFDDTFTGISSSTETKKYKTNYGYLPLELAALKIIKEIAKEESK